MRIIIYTIKLAAVSVAMAAILGGCTEKTATDYVRMQKGPAPEIVAESGGAKMLPAGFIKRRLRLGYPSLENIVINDRQYIYITEKWFKDVMVWTEDFIEVQVPEVGGARGYPVGYEETFALLSSNIANMSVARRYNLNGSVLIGLVTAKNNHEWGAIQADGKDRVYVIGLTEKDGVVYDVRTKQTIGINKFPNIDSIKSILF